MPTATANRQPIGHAHFTVDFGFLTETARNFWAEHSFDRALRLITCNGIDLEIAHDIIRGKKKMVQDPAGKKGVDGKIASDNWKPNLRMCQHGIYPDPNQINKYAQDGIGSAAALRDLLARQTEDNVDRIFSEIAEAVDENDFDQVLHLFEIYDELPAAVRKRRPLPYNRDFMADCARRARAQAAAKKAGIKLNDPVDQFIAHQRDLDTRPAPKPSRDFTANNAWILPDGKFYPLKSAMEHIWGANAIAGISERDAEIRGWLKISLSIFDINLIIHKKPTQRQIDTLFDWMQADEPRRWNAFNEFKRRECEE